MKIIKGSTVKGQKMFKMNLHSIGTTLNEVYKSYSAEKYEAYKRCRDKFFRECGTNFRITSKNIHCFTVAWDIVNEFGQVVGVRIETAYNSYYIDCTL